MLEKGTIVLNAFNVKNILPAILRDKALEYITHPRLSVFYLWQILITIDALKVCSLMNGSALPTLTEDTLRLILQSAPIAIVAVDAKGKIIYVNDKFCELFQYSSQALLGEPLERLLPTELRDIHVRHRSQFMQSPYVRTMGSGMDLSGLRKDGSQFPLEAGLSPIQIGEEKIVLTTVVDITNRKQVEDALELRVQKRTAEIEHRRRVADSMRAILSRLNADYSLNETLQYIVDQTEDLLGADGSAIFYFDNAHSAYRIQVWHGLEQIDLVHMSIPYHSDSLLKQVLTAREAACVSDLTVGSIGEDTTAEYRRQLLLASGYRALIVVPLMVNDEAYGGLVTYYNKPHNFDEEEIKLASLFGTQISLAIQNAHLRTRGEEQAVTAERSRIARDLHDSVTQTLFSASMIADVLPLLWTMKPEEGERRLEELRELTRGALAEMRTLLLELRPATLEDVPLPELLQQLIEGIAARGKLDVELQVDGACEMPVDVRVAFFRTAQEAMNNIAKHSQAQSAIVTLVCTPAVVTLRIADDGCGFVLDKISPNHLGLDIMRERAAAIGGDLTIQSSLGNGTTIQLSWQRSDS